MVNAWLTVLVAVVIAQSDPSRLAAAGLQIGSETQSTDRTRDAARIAAFAACHRDFLGQLYTPDPNLWVVERGASIAYVLGVEHRLPVDFLWRSDVIERAVAHSTMLMTETGLGSVGSDDPRVGADEPMIVGNPIETRLSGLRRAKWQGMAAIMPPATLSRINGMPSWMAAQAINEIAERRYGPPMEPGPDRQLVDLFKTVGKPVERIETELRLSDYATVLDERAQRRMLAESVDGVGTSAPAKLALANHHAWARGGTDPLGLAKGLRARSAMSNLVDGLATTRNAAWAKRIDDRLRDGHVTFVAVGAAHLYGPTSLFSYLRSAGLRERLISSPMAAPVIRSAVYHPTTWAECGEYLKYPVGRLGPSGGKHDR